MKVLRFFANRVFLTAILALGVSHFASAAGFIKFDGVNGESQASGHTNESDILSWSWGVHRPAEGETGSTRRRGDAIIGDVVITKVMDSASVKLLESVTQGRVYPKVTLTLETPGSNPVTYFVVEMTNVLLSSFSFDGSAGEDRPNETIALNFEEVKATYSRFNSDGSPAGNVEMTWKVEEGTP